MYNFLCQNVRILSNIYCLQEEATNVLTVNLWKEV